MFSPGAAAAGPELRISPSRTVTAPLTSSSSPAGCLCPSCCRVQVLMSEHLVECGLYLFKYLRQLQVEACYEGSFPLQVGTARLSCLAGVTRCRVAQQLRRRPDRPRPRPALKTAKTRPSPAAVPPAPSPPAAVPVQRAAAGARPRLLLVDLPQALLSAHRSAQQVCRHRFGGVGGVGGGLGGELTDRGRLLLTHTQSLPTGKRRICRNRSLSPAPCHHPCPRPSSCPPPSPPQDPDVPSHRCQPRAAVRPGAGGAHRRRLGGAGSAEAGRAGAVKPAPAWLNNPNPPPANPAHCPEKGLATGGLFIRTCCIPHT